MGAVLVPGSLQLTKKDIAYRANAANIEMFICVNDAYVVEQMELALPEAPGIKNIGLVDGYRDGWFNFHDEVAKFSYEYARPIGEDASKNEDIMQIYFTSGTTGMPKMVCHNYLHPLGHIVTANYWQQVDRKSVV